MTATAHKPRPYQIEALQGTYASWRRGFQRTGGVAGTGAGKSVVISHVVRDYVDANPGRRVVVFAHRQELIDALADKIRRELPGMRVGIVKANKNQTRAPIVVGSVQTLAARDCARARMIQDVGLVVCDEAHHASSPSYVDVLTAFGCFDPGSGVIALGVTATMSRADGKNLGDVWQDIAFEIPMDRLINEGWLVRPYGIRVDVGDLDLDNVRSTGGDYAAGALGQALDTSLAPKLTAKAINDHAGNRQGIVFVPRVESAYVFAEAIAEYGRAVEVLHGKTKDDERQAILARYKSGQIRHIVNCLDMKTEILTRRGWVGPNDIREDDVTAAVSTHGQVSWEPISRIVRRRREPEERMIHIKNKHLDIRVTEGHRMMYRTAPALAYRFIEAGKLPDRAGSYRLPMSGREDHIGVPLSKCDLEFLGLFATDGSLNRERASIEIAAAVGSSVRPEIERILTECEFDWKMTQRMSYAPSGKECPAVVYRIPKGNIGGKLARRGWGRLEKWLDKSLSPELERCTEVQFAHLLHGLWIGDGFKSRVSVKGRDTRICGIDLTMFDRLQAWAAVRGYSTNLSINRNTSGGRYPDSQIATLGLHKRDDMQTNNHTLPTSGGNPAKMEADWLDEEVWCVTNETGSIITRRNGHVVVMGQCGVLTEGTDLPMTGFVCIARPTKSENLYTQMAGRAVRLFCLVGCGIEDRGMLAGVCPHCKVDALVLDVAGVTRRVSLGARVQLFGQAEAERIERDARVPREPGEATEAEEPEYRDGDVLVHEVVDLFGVQSTRRWLRTYRGVYFLPAKDRLIAVLPAEQSGRYDVVGMARSMAGQAMWVARNLPNLGLARAAAEQNLTAAEKRATSKDLKRRVEPLAAAPELFARYALPPGATRGHLEDAVDVQLASQRIDPVVEAMPHVVARMALPPSP